MKQLTETVLSEMGIELLVEYNAEETKGHVEFHENPSSVVEPTIYTELLSVELVIGGDGVKCDILPHMTERSKKHIISLLQYTEL